MFMNKKTKEKVLVKLKDNTINLMKSDENIDCTKPLNQDYMLKVIGYFCDLEVSLAQEIEENGEKNVSRSYLEDVCSAVDDLNIDSADFDLQDLNDRLGLL